MAQSAAVLAVSGLSRRVKILLELVCSKLVYPTCRHQNEGNEAAAFVTTG